MTKKSDEKLPRVRKQPSHKSFRLSKNSKPALSVLPSGWFIAKKSLQHLWLHKKLYLGLALTYGLLSALLVRSVISGADVANISSTLQESSAGGFGTRLLDSVGILGSLLGGSGEQVSESTSLYQFLVLVICSLAIIWALRRTRKQEPVSVRDAFYFGMTPLVPFILTIGLLLFMFLPAALGGTVYMAVLSKALATTFVEHLLWAMLFFLTLLLSIYLLTSSIFALYIVTMPGMSPLLAVRSSRNIARYRRFTIMRKLLLLPLLLLILNVTVLLPVILYMPLAAEVATYAVLSVGLVFSHTYLFNLYRELI